MYPQIVGCELKMPIDTKMSKTSENIYSKSKTPSYVILSRLCYWHLPFSTFSFLRTHFCFLELLVCSFSCFLKLFICYCSSDDRSPSSKFLISSYFLASPCLFCQCSQVPRIFFLLDCKLAAYSSSTSLFGIRLRFY